MNMLQTQRLCMTLNINLTKTLNPTQNLIYINDQPVYAFTKELQYHYSHLFGKYCPIKETCISSKDHYFVYMVIHCIHLTLPDFFNDWFICDYSCQSHKKDSSCRSNSMCFFKTTRSFGEI